MNELVFEVTQESDGGFVAECLTEAIFSQADTWDDLCSNVREAVQAFSGDSAQQPTIRLLLVDAGILRPGAGDISAALERPPVELAVNLSGALDDERADRL